METIKSNERISQVFKLGKRYSNQFVTFIFVERKPDPNEKPAQHDLNGRVAFIAGKKNGNAVWRNGAKRRLREIYRQLDGDWKHTDILFIAKSPILKTSYSKVLSECKITLDKIRIAKAEDFSHE